MTKYILFDAANTLIHKPMLWQRLEEVLLPEVAPVADFPLVLRHTHKMLSEIVHFPDRTSKEFYATFNQELLLLLGIIPTPALLDRMFTACTYLPWEPFADTVALPQLPLPYGVLSNFHSGLGDLLRQLLPDAQFSHICISENMGVRKPDPEFFRQAAAIIGYAPEEILFVGDSMKLDVTPAQHVGMQARLIDREGFFAASVHQLGGLDALLSEISR